MSSQQPLFPCLPFYSGKQREPVSLAGRTKAERGAKSQNAKKFLRPHMSMNEYHLAGKFQITSSRRAWSTRQSTASARPPHVASDRAHRMPQIVGSPVLVLK